MLEASQWLRAKRTDQWASPWPGEEARNERIRAAIRAGRTWVAWDGAQPAAAITTIPNDHQIWPKDIQRDPAIYIRRLVVARRYAGQSLGAQLVDWAGDRARREYGARWVRVEAWPADTELHAYFRRSGFEFCGFDDVQLT